MLKHPQQKLKPVNSPMSSAPVTSASRIIGSNASQLHIGDLLMSANQSSLSSTSSSSTANSCPLFTNMSSNNNSISSCSIQSVGAIPKQQSGCLADQGSVKVNPAGAVGGSLVRILNAPKLGIVTPKLGLLGGGETSTSTAQTSNWGAPGPSTSTAGMSGWGAAGSGPSGNAVVNAPWPSNEETPSAGAVSWAATAGGHGSDKNQMRGASNGNPEQDELRRLAAFSQGWGMVSVNQDSSWDGPMTPKDSPAPQMMQHPPKSQQASSPQMLQGGLMWDSRSEAAQLLHVRGTDIWECSIRQKGSKAPGGGASVSAAMQQQPPHHQQQAPWQNPASHIGGTWGEEEVENPNAMWTGVPPPNVAPPGMGLEPPASQWPPQGPPPEKQWGAPAPSPHSQGNPHSWGQPAMAQPDATTSWTALKDALVNYVSPPPGAPQGMHKEWEPNVGPDHSQMPPPYDDRVRMGTAAWGSPGMQDKVSRWKDMPAPGVSKYVPWNPYEMSVKPKIIPMSDWSEGQIDTSTWGGPTKQSCKPLSKDLILASKHYRILTALGYPKEDVESALRRYNMNMEHSFLHLSLRRALNGSFRRDPPIGGPSNMNHAPFAVGQWEPHGPLPPMNHPQQLQPQQPQPQPPQQQMPPQQQPPMGQQHGPQQGPQQRPPQRQGGPEPPPHLQQPHHPQQQQQQPQQQQPQQQPQQQQQQQQQQPHHPQQQQPQQGQQQQPPRERKTATHRDFDKN